MPPPGTSSTYAIVARSISLQLNTSNYECAARHAPMHEWQLRSARLARVTNRNGPAAALSAGTAVLDPLRTVAKVGFGELRQCHDRRKAWSGWRVKPAANTRSHNESTPVARCSNRPGAFRGLRPHDIIRRKVSARMPVPTEYQVKG